MRKKDNKGTIIKILKYLKPYWFWAAMSLIFCGSDCCADAVSAYFDR